MSTRVVTGKVRLSYAHLFEKHAISPGDDPKYSVMLLIPKRDKKTLEALRAAEAEAAEAGKTTKFGGKIPSNLATIIRDGDDPEFEDFEERHGHYFMNVSSNRKPGVVDQDTQPVLDATEVYSGCYARVSVTAFPYTYGNKKGISFGLNNVQKVADGEAFGGSGIKAEDEFSAVDDDEDLI